MLEKISSNEYKITSDNEVYLHSLLYIPSSEIRKIIIDGKEQLALFFKAKNVVPLKQLLISQEYLLTYNQSLRLYKNIITQLLFLKRYKQGIPSFLVEDIMIIDNVTCFYYNTNNIFNISDDHIIITKPISTNRKRFSSPVLISQTDIPMKLYYNESYYSLAILITHLLTKYIPETYHVDEFKGVLLPIYATKLYWCLIRCIERKIALLI